MDRKIIDPYDPIKGRVPEYDHEKKMFKIELKSFEYFRKEAEDYNKYLERRSGNHPDYYTKMYPEEAFIKATLDSREGIARGWSLQYAQDAQRHIEALKRLEKIRRYYENLERTMPEDERWKILRQDAELTNLSGGFIPPEVRSPVEMIDKIMADTKRRLDYDRSSSSSQEQQAQDTHETKEHIITPIKRLEKHGVRLYAE